MSANPQSEPPLTVSHTLGRDLTTLQDASSGSSDPNRGSNCSADKDSGPCSVYPSVLRQRGGDHSGVSGGPSATTATAAAAGSVRAIPPCALPSCELSGFRCGSVSGCSSGPSDARPGESATANSLPMPQPSTWHKVLYERQPFEDNYVDPGQFLEGLRENENVQGYQYRDVVGNTFAIVQQISLVVCFVRAFGHVLTSAGGGYTLFMLDTAILVMTWAMYIRYRKLTRRRMDEGDLMVFRESASADAAAGSGGLSAAPVTSFTAIGGGVAGNGPMNGGAAAVATSPSEVVCGVTPMLLPQMQAVLQTPEDAHGIMGSGSGGGGPGTGRLRGRSPAAAPLSGRMGPGASAAAAAGGAGGASPASGGAAVGRARPVPVKDGSEPAHSDVPLTFSYVTDFGRKVISLGSFIVLLTPVLSTLTVTYSNDTIIALSILTMSMHVLTANYSYLNGYTDNYTPDLSVNSALFGVVLMASRIPSPLESGSLIAFGAFCFSLSPIARHMVKRYSAGAHAGTTLGLFVLAALLLASVPVLCFFFVLTGVVIALVVPWWFVSLHSRVKYQISGPWDEAKPTNSAAAAEWANAGLLR